MLSIFNSGYLEQGDLRTFPPVALKEERSPSQVCTLKGFCACDVATAERLKSVAGFQFVSSMAVSKSQSSNASPPTVNNVFEPIDCVVERDPSIINKSRDELASGLHSRIDEFSVASVVRAVHKAYCSCLFAGETGGGVVG